MQDQPAPPGPLPEIEEQFRLLLECVTDCALFLLDAEGKVAAWNVGAARILGYGAEEVIGQSFARFFTPEDQASGVPKAELQTARQQGRASDDRWLLRKDGTRILVAGFTTALKDDHRIRGFAKVVQDRTEQHRLEESLRLSERRYRALVENAWDGVTLVAADGTMLETTPSTFRGLGYEPEEYVGRNGFELLHPDDVPMARDLLERVLRDPGAKVTAQYRLRHKDGSWRWVDAVACNLLSDPSLKAIVVNHRDITEQKEAESRKDEWLTMLAHELRGPLSPVSTAVEVLIRQDAASGDLQQAKEVIARQVQHMARLVDGLLETTRLIRGEIRLARERLDLARLVRLAGEDYRLVLRQAGMSLKLEAPETPVWIIGDATRLRQVLANLIDNAIKFKDGGAEVEVLLRADEWRAVERGERSELTLDDRSPRSTGHGQATLTVRDKGIGIDRNLLPVLFQVFSQGDRTLSRAQGGLGLGLSIVKGLVEMHGGEVRVASAGLHRGAEFTVLLPLEGEPAALADGAGSTPTTQHRMRILVVEDHRDAANSLQLLLSLLGHEVRVAATGPEGVQSAIAWAPDVIISDIGLPGLDGYGVASALRQNPVTSKARLIAVSGYGSEEDRRRSREAGFDFHLVKPADPDVLLRLLG
jgi:PAS domain S-box-containing protein